MTLRARPVGLAAVFVLLLLAVGCGSGGDGDGDGGAAAGEDLAGLEESTELDELVAAAQEDGQVTIYSSQAQGSLDVLAERFEDEYDIPVEIVRGIDADLEARLGAESTSGQQVADLVVVADAGWVEEQEAAGAFVEPAGPELTGSGDYDVEQYVHGSTFEVNAALLTYAWNTGAYPDGIDDYEDLLDPELAGGKIAVIEPTAGSIVDFYWWLEETFGEDFVEDLAAQEPRIYPSALPIGEALASGEVFAAAYAAPATLEPAKESGAPVEYGISEEGAWGARYLAGVLADAPNPDAAQLLANFMVTATGQEAIAAAAGSVLPDIPGTLITNDELRVIDVERQTPEAIEEYQARWRSLFQ